MAQVIHNHFWCSQLAYARVFQRAVASCRLSLLYNPTSTRKDGPSEYDALYDEMVMT